MLREIGGACAIARGGRGGGLRLPDNRSSSYIISVLLGTLTPSSSPSASHTDKRRKALGFFLGGGEGRCVRIYLKKEPRNIG